MGTTYYVFLPREKLAFSLPSSDYSNLDAELAALEKLIDETENPLDTEEVTVRGLTLAQLRKLVSMHDLTARLGYDLPLVAFVQRMKAYDHETFIASEHHPDIKDYRRIDLDPSKP